MCMWGGDIECEIVTDGGYKNIWDMIHVLMFFISSWENSYIEFYVHNINLVVRSENNMDSSLQFGCWENGQRKLYIRKEGFQKEMKFELTLAIFINLESNDVNIVWSEVECGN